MDPKQFRQIVKEEVTTIIEEKINTALEPVKNDLKEVKNDLKELREDVDAARGDIEIIRIDVQAIREKQGMYHSRNKREIDEIKTHIGLPLMPDTPAV